MNKINEYVDNLFANLPENDDVRVAKQTITENMTDKYEELLSEGKSEAEAFGLTVSEFGSIKELGKEMGWDFWESQPRESAASKDPSTSKKDPVDSFVDAAKETSATFSAWRKSPQARVKSKIMSALIVRFLVVFLVIGFLGEALSRNTVMLTLFSVLAAVGLTFYSRSPLHIDINASETPSAANETVVESSTNKG